MRAVSEGAPIVLTCNRGVDQSSHPRLSPIGTFDTVQNMRVRANGILEKRPGSRAIGVTQTDCLPSFTSSTLPAPSFIASSGDLGLIGTSRGAVYVHQEVDDALIASGRFSTCQPVRRRGSIVGFAEGQTILPAGYGMDPPSTAVNSSGYVMVVAVSDGGDMTAFLETPTGTRIATRSETTGTVVHARVVSVGAGFILTWIDGTALKAQTCTISANAVAFGTEVTLSSAVHSTSALDACSANNGTHWVVAFQNSGAPSVDLIVLLMTGTTTSATVTVSINAASTPFSLYSNGTNLWVGWSSSTEAHYLIYLTADLSVVKTDTVLLSPATSPGAPLFGEGSSASEAFCVVRSDFAAGLGFICHGVLTSTSGATTVTTVYGATPLSKPDPDGRVWMMAGSTQGELSRVFLGRLFPQEAVNAITIELSLDEMITFNDPFTSRSYFAESPVTSGGRGFFAAPVVLAEIGGLPLARVDLLEYSTVDEEPHRSTVSANSSLFIAGQPVEALALPLGFTDLDGVSASRFFAEGSAELGFVLAPVINVTITASGGGLEPGDYVFYAVYEWIDQRGQRHQSQPSEPITKTVTVTGSSADVTYIPCEFTQRRSSLAPVPRPYLVIYRTLVGGTTAHRLPEADPSLVGSYAADAVDSVIEDEEILYTQGGVLANNLAPSCRFMRYAAGRLWCGGLWFEDLLEASKLIVPNEQVAFTNDATHRVSIGGPCTGLAVQDDQLVAFLADSIVLIVGEGPNDQGAGGSFAVRSLSSGIGCIDGRSVAETDIGIFFRSRLGVCLLPRGFGAAQYVGAPVRDVVADFTETLGAAVWHGNNQYLARFLVRNEDDGETRVLSYELNSGQWFVDTFERDLAEIGVWPDGFVLCKESLSTLDGILSNRPIWIEDVDQVADGVWSSFTGHHIEQRIRSNWITPAGPGGWAEAKQTIFAILAETAASVTLRFEADTEDDEHQTTVALSADADVQYRYLVPLERHGVGVRVSAWDNEVSSEPAAGVKFIAITLESELDGGLRPPDTGERV